MDQSQGLIGSQGPAPRGVPKGKERQRDFQAEGPEVSASDWTRTKVSAAGPPLLAGEKRREEVGSFARTATAVRREFGEQHVWHRKGNKIPSHTLVLAFFVLSSADTISPQQHWSYGSTPHSAGKPAGFCKKIPYS